MKHRSSTRGFTLLEALVVLIITALVSVVLIQGFGLLLGARTSVRDKIVDVDHAIVEQNMILEPLRGVVPDYPDKPNLFMGDAERLRGITTRPLQGRTGTSVPFMLSLGYDASRGVTTLTYQEEGYTPLVVTSWAGRSGAFSYRDLAGDWRTAWPPENDPQAPQTPWLIRLERGTGFPKNLVASVAGAHQRPLRFRDTPFGAGMPP